LINPDKFKQVSLVFLILFSLSIFSNFLLEDAYADHTSHDYAKKITIESDNVDSNLTDFPLLINFTDSDLSSNAFSDGLRITFTDDLDNELSHEIEQYTSGSGWITAWVKVPTISSSVDTEITMWYGNNTNLADQQSITDTWRSEYKAVYHLHDDFLDSTSTGNHLTNQGTSTIASQIADGQDYDGTDDIVFRGSDSMSGIDVNQKTFSLWINNDDVSASEFLMITGPVIAGGNLRGALIINSDDYLVHQQKATNIGTWNVATDVADGNPHYLVSSMDIGNINNTPLMYLDGSLGTVVETFNPTGSFSTGEDNFVSGENVGGSSDLSGEIDEMRIYAGILSADWIDFEYCNQVGNGTCASLFYLMG